MSGGPVPLAGCHEDGLRALCAAVEAAGERMVGLDVDLFMPFADEVRRLEAWARGDVPSGFPPRDTWVLLEEGKLVALCTVRHALTENLSAAVGHVDLTVHPDHRRKGLGRGLLQAARVRLGELGVEQMVLTTPAAGAFLEACGAELAVQAGPLGTYHLQSVRPPSLWQRLFGR